jgi:hypothetical protein
LVELHSYTSTHSTHQPASAPSVEEREGEAQSAEGQTGLGRRDYTVRLFSLCAALDVADVSVNE